MEESTINLNEAENHDATEQAYFNPLEARIIGALMEKHLTTPQNYPLTSNSLTNACNQKSNREPVMKLTEGQIGHTVNKLVERNLAGLEYGERANKITHRVCVELNINRKEQALLTVLLLRAPQTLNDLKTRTARMVDFSSIEEIQDTLNHMKNREKPLISMIPKGMGRREERYANTLCGDVKVETIAAESLTIIPTDVDNERLEAIEARLTAIEEKLGLH